MDGALLEVSEGNAQVMAGWAVRFSEVFLLLAIHIRAPKWPWLPQAAAFDRISFLRSWARRTAKATHWAASFL